MTRLYDENAEDLLRFFARRVVDPQVAFDLVSETFAEAITHRKRFRGDSMEDARRWLYGIARNLMNNYFRRGQVEQRAIERLQFEPTQLTHHDFAEIEELAQLEEMREVVRVAVGRLKPAYRDALQARILDQRSYSEIAEAEGIAEDVVRARVSRGLKMLKGELARAESEKGRSDG
jgi:RNA polymerase sigma-70 factor (ECF subfamily)